MKGRTSLKMAIQGHLGGDLMSLIFLFYYCSVHVRF